MSPRALLAPVAALSLFVLTAPRALAQDSRAAAERLHRLIDRKIEELRAELHREIDAALGGPRERLGLKLGPLSDEFRRVHGIPAGCGVRVEAVELGSEGARKLGFRAGDVVLSVWPGRGPSRWVASVSDIAWALSEAGDVWAMASAVVVRNGERVTTATALSPGGLITPFDASETRPLTEETADQMVERLWNQAVRQVIPESGGEVRTGEVGPESRPGAPESRPSPK